MQRGLGIGLSIVFGVVGLLFTSGIRAQSTPIFTASDEYLTTATRGNWSRDVALGDVDGDGDLDAVVTQSGSGTQEHILWLNDGQANFAESPQQIGSGQGNALVLADLDNDGDLDLAASGSSNDTYGVDIVLNQGGIQGGSEGQFTGTQFITQSGFAIAAGDLDGDNDVDLVLENQVWWNDGSASFSAGPNLDYDLVQDVALGDLDNDGDLDIVSASEASNFPGWTSRVIWNDWAANQSFDTGQLLDNDGINNGVGLADLDSDGWLDIYFASSRADAVWWNNGDQSFTVGLLADERSDSDVALGDLDGDGDLDAYVSRRVGTPSDDSVWLNTGNRTFTASADTLGSWTSYRVALGDLDADGDLDAFVAESGPNSVWINVGGAAPAPTPTPTATPALPQPGEFVDSGQTLGSGGQHDLALGDIDADGDPDVVTSDFFGLEVFINQGNGNFSESAAFFLDVPGGRFESDLALADLDGDNDLDIFTTGADAVWLNDGQGEFQITPALPNAHTAEFALGDVDADGDIDALVWQLPVGDLSDQIRLWLNQGGSPPTFIDSGQNLGTRLDYTIQNLSLVDVDNDGDLDAAITNQGMDGQVYANALWFNQGNAQGGITGNFTNTNQALGNGHTNQLVWGDVDGDGDPDAFAANGNLETRADDVLWFNDGSGQLTQSSTEFGAAVATNDAAMADVDGDNDLDVLTVGYGANRVWLNNGTGQFRDSEQILGSKVSQAVVAGDVDGDGDVDAVIADDSFIRVWLNGELPTKPVAYVPYGLEQGGANGQPVFSVWQLQNARLPIRMAGLQAERTVNLWVDISHIGNLGFWNDVLTYTATTPEQYPTAGAEQEGGEQDRIWNPYFGSETLPDSTSYNVRVSSPGDEVIVSQVERIQVTFYNRDFGPRNCFLSGIGLLTGQNRPILRGLQGSLDLDVFRSVHDEVMADTPQGRYYSRLYTHHSPELLQITAENIWLVPEATRVLEDWTPALQALTTGQGDSVIITEAMVRGVRNLLSIYAQNGSSNLQSVIETELEALDLESFIDMSMDEALAQVNTRSVSEVYLPLVLR